MKLGRGREMGEENADHLENICECCGSPGQRVWSCWNSPGGHESTGHNESTADCASGQSLCNDRSCQPVSAFVPVSGSPRLLGSMPPKLHQKSSKYLYHCLSLLSNVAMFSWSPITFVDQRYQEALLPRLQLAPAVPPGTPTQQRLDLLQVIELNGSICRSCWICSNLINLESSNFKLINWIGLSITNCRSFEQNCFQANTNGERLQ